MRQSHNTSLKRKGQFNFLIDRCGIVLRNFCNISGDFAVYAADGLMFILDNLQDYKHSGDYGAAKCPKFNLVGAEEINNLALAQLIADVQGKELKYDMVDFHSSRPGHDLRYSLSGEYMKSLGWVPKITLTERISQVVQWTLENDRWLK